MRISEIYYEQMNSKDATDAHTTIQSLSMKRKWSKTEITQLKDRWPLSGTPPVFKEYKQHIRRTIWHGQNCQRGVPQMAPTQVTVIVY